MVPDDFSTRRPTERAPSFATTHWSVVLAAGRDGSPQAAEALEKLCRTYWYPLYAFVRRRGYAVPDAQDLTQEFFARFLAGNVWAQAQPGKGRFRSFLLASLKHFLVNEWKHGHCLKRGGGQILIPLDAADAETRYATEPSHELTAEKNFERRWALTLLAETMARLREQYRARGQAPLFDRLKGSLTGEKASLGQIANDLGLSEAAVKMAALRLRQRYRQTLRAEVAHTVVHPAEVDDELRHLFQALR